jgi:hypothetical protein
MILHARRAATLLVLVAVVAGGCGATASPAGSSAPSASASPSPSPSPSPAPIATPSLSAAPSPSPSAGMATTGRIVNTADGYALTLPAGWVRLDPNPASMDAYLSSLSGARPEARQLVEAAAAAFRSGLLIFLAFDTSSLTVKSFSDLAVIRAPSGGLTLEALLPLTATQLKTVPSIVQPIRTSIVTLPAGKAGKLVYAIRMPVAGLGTITITAIQFVLIKAGSMYVVTFGTTAPLKTREAALTRIANTFEVLP